MNIKIAFLITVLFTTFISKVHATEGEVILIEAEIYKHPTAKKQSEVDEFLTGAILESSPVLIMKVGGKAKIEIGLQHEDGSDDDMLRLDFKSDSLGEKYTVDFQINSQGSERISSVETQLNSILVLSTSLYGTLKIAKIKTRKFANAELALQAKDD